MGPGHGSQRAATCEQVRLAPGSPPHPEAEGAPRLGVSTSCAYFLAAMISEKRDVGSGTRQAAAREPQILPCPPLPPPRAPGGLSLQGLKPRQQDGFF